MRVFVRLIVIVRHYADLLPRSNCFQCIIVSIPEEACTDRSEVAPIHLQIRIEIFSLVIFNEEETHRIDASDEHGSEIIALNARLVTYLSIVAALPFAIDLFPVESSVDLF